MLELQDMYTERVLVTPELARILLGKNANNRKIRPRRVEQFIAALSSGNFVEAAKGLEVSNSGQLVDGQHRLTAIVASGISAQMRITHNVPESHNALTNDALPWSAGERLNLNAKDISIVKVLHRFCGDGKSSFYDSSIVNDIKLFGGALARWHALPGKSAYRGCETMPYCAAFVLRLANALHLGDVAKGEYAILVADKLRRSATNEADCPPVAHAFYVYSLENQGGSGNGSAARDRFIRAWILFDPSKRNIKRIYLGHDNGAKSKAEATATYARLRDLG